MLYVVYGKGADTNRQAAIQGLPLGTDAVIAGTIVNRAAKPSALFPVVESALAAGRATVLQVSCTDEAEARAAVVGLAGAETAVFVPAPTR